MKILLDMNLSPVWVELLGEKGHEVVHWGSIGSASASDAEIMEWARTNGYVIFTHDLDFGDLLAAMEAKGPSVVQIRTKNVKIPHMCSIVVDLLKEYKTQLTAGALISMNDTRSRIRILPIK